MYDLDLKVIKKGKTIWFIFLVFGLFFMLIFGGIGLSTMAKEKKMDGETTSTRMEYDTYYDSEDGTMYEPVYWFEHRGREYMCDPKVSQSWMPKQQETIYYETKNPENCMTDMGGFSIMFLLIGCGIPAIFIIISVLGLIKINKRVKKVMELNDIGKLIKGMPYRLEPTGTTINDRPVMRPVVDYVLPSGSTVQLRGDGRYDFKQSDADGLVDVVIDPNNPDNYFIDFEINRLGGNQSSDYYVNPNQPQQQVNDPYHTNYGTFGTFK